MNREEVYDWSPSTGNVGMYLIHDGKLVELIGRSGELAIPTGRWSSIIYSEELDGEVMGREEAIEKYPEYFV